MRDPSSVYNKLFATERFRLALDALARGDYDDVRRLSDTCPEYKYWSIDIDYASRLAAAPTIAFFAATLLYRARMALEAPMLFRDVFEEVLNLAPDAPPAEVEALGLDSEEWGAIKNVHSDRVSDLVGVCEGIGRFCGEIGVESSTLLRLDQHCLGIWEWGLELGKTLGPDEQIAVGAHKALAGLWASLVPTEGIG